MIFRLWGFLNLLIAVGLEAFGQLSFKHATQRNSSSAGTWATIKAALADRWIAFGIIFFVVEAVFYTMAMHYVDVSISFPAGAMAFVLVAFFSRWFLKEKVGPRRWIGIAFILLGVLFIGIS